MVARTSGDFRFKTIPARFRALWRRRLRKFLNKKQKSLEPVVRIAVFMPKDLNSTPLLARVVPGSPAASAGIRNGDRLLKVGDLDVTAWRTEGFPPFWKRPAGTELVLTLARGTEQLKVSVKLEELFPDASRYDP